MKTDKDEEIQALLDTYYSRDKTDEPEMESKEFDLYITVYEALAQDNIKVPKSFANKVTAEIFYKEERKKALTNRLLNTAIIAVLIIVGYISLNIFGFSIDTHFLLESTTLLLPIASLVLLGSVVEVVLTRKEASHGTN